MNPRKSTVVRRVGNFWRIYGWVLADLIRHSRWRLLLYLGLNTLGVSTRALSYATVILFVRSQINDEPIVIAGMALPAGTSLGVLLLWGCAALAFACFTALTSYTSEAMNFAISRRYVFYGAERVLEIVAGHRPIRVPEDIDGKATPLNFVHRLLGGGMSVLLRLLVVVIAALGPFMMSLVAVALLLYINLWLSIALLVVAAAYAVPFYKLNRSIVQASRDRELFSRRASSVARSLATFILRSRYERASEPDWSRFIARETEFGRNVEAFRGIILIRKGVESLKEVAFGLALLLLVVAFGLYVGGDAAWDILLAYLIALQLTMSGLNSVAGTVTSMNRLLPQVARYVEFRQCNERPAPAATLAAPVGENGDAPIEFRAEPDLPDSLDAVRPKPGEVLCVVHPARVERQSLDAFFKLLTARSESTAADLAARSFFHGSPSPPPVLMLRELIVGSRRPTADEEQRIEGVLGEMGSLEEFQRLERGLETIVELDANGRISPGLGYMIGVMHGLLGRQRYVVLTSDSLAPLEEAFRRRLLDVLSDRVVMIVHPTMPPLQPPEANCTIVLGDKGIRGIGDADWHARITPLVQAETPTGAAEVGAADSLEDELDLM